MTAPSAPAPLLIACALGIERLALRGRDRAGAGGPVTVLRTGMGARAAERSVTRALADPGLRDAAVLATGFCAGLAPGMRPGDLVVAEETWGPGDAVTRCVSSRRLVEEVRRAVPGRAVHTGPLTGSDHVVRGQERSELHATGALAVDMESAVTLHCAVRSGARPVAAVRVVVDAPEHELVRIGTVRGGISAFRVLRAVLPAYYEWHRSLLLPRR
ncbi:1-hydroxy-2-methyl-2-butenyl 4-diphosphate reductase [Streptomyces sp. VNUA24]|uniref:phosphorylase family protein n=1 Tax=Streptomyces sp. VNUA24 TaxID=3031131 RepID=UPI0023B82706|nr:1-hydroxy-2-methyl-2-butenyl 4-diphosphate reductase [Streptomyces sp. VNUA24]WEH14192.1 1-hydroxy-2-methyl-2-butenyl 4-diphosphate reductase [Streptomyces sp. VNUA24]